MAKKMSYGSRGSHVYAVNSLKDLGFGGSRKSGGKSGKVGNRKGGKSSKSNE